VVSSAFVAQTPVGLSLLSLAAVAILVQAFCGERVLWLSAAIGHTASTVVVYLALGVVALADHDLVGRLLSEQDYGVSAIFAAWIGAVTARIWIRPQAGWPDKLAAVLLCLVTVLVAWLVRGEPAPGVLDSEHLVAFAIGWALAAAQTRESAVVVPVAA
jgi:membrane associated rhomboid family serine protease